MLIETTTYYVYSPQSAPVARSFAMYRDPLTDPIGKSEPTAAASPKDCTQSVVTVVGGSQHDPSLQKRVINVDLFHHRRWGHGICRQSVPLLRAPFRPCLPYQPNRPLHRRHCPKVCRLSAAVQSGTLHTVDVSLSKLAFTDR